MLYTEIDNFIAGARKSGNKTALKVLQLIKSEFQKFLTSSKDAKLDTIQEAKILLKMQSQWLEELDSLKKANRDTIELEATIRILQEFTPELPSESKIIEYTKEVVASYDSVSMKDMKSIMNKVKEKYPLADGKIISQVVKNTLQ